MRLPGASRRMLVNAGVKDLLDQPMHTPDTGQDTKEKCTQRVKNFGLIALIWYQKVGWLKSQCCAREVCSIYITITIPMRRCCFRAVCVTC